MLGFASLAEGGVADSGDTAESSQVSASLSCSYAVSQQVAASFEGSYSINGASIGVSASMGGSYQVRARVWQGHFGGYQVFARLSASMGGSYTVGMDVIDLPESRLFGLRAERRIYFLKK